MRTRSLLAASVLALAASPAAAQNGPSPIEFIIGDQVVTRAEVRRPIAQQTVDPAKRLELFRQVRLKMAQDRLLYQYARHLGVSVSEAQVTRFVERQIREATDGETFAKSLDDLYGGLEAFRAHVRRRQTIGRLEARAQYGPELTAAPPAAPERILFSRHRPRSVLDRFAQTAKEMAEPLPGQLFVARVSARAMEIADDPEHPMDRSQLEAAKEEAAENLAAQFVTRWRLEHRTRDIRAALAKQQVPERAYEIESVGLWKDDWLTEIYDPEKVPLLYRAIRALQAGDVTEPVKQGPFRYVAYLVSLPHRKHPGPEDVQSNIERNLDSENFSAKQSQFVLDALLTTFVWPESLKAELRERHTTK